MILPSLRVQRRCLGAFSKGFRVLLSFDHCYYFSLGYYDKLNRNVDNVIKVIDKLNKIAAKMQDFEKHIFFSISPLNYISWICSIHALCDFRRRWKLPQNANLWKNPLKCGRKMTFCPAPVAHMFPIFHFMGLKYSHFKGFTYFVYLMRRHINICKEFH